MKKLGEANIHSAPVYEGDKCLGLVDLCDIVSFLVHIFFKKSGVTDEADVPAASAHLAGYAFHKQDFEEGKGMSYRFGHQLAKDLINFSKQNCFNPFPVSASLHDLIKALGNGIRRVPIVDAQGKVLALVSQSTIVSFLAKNITKVSLASKTLEELGIARKKVFSVPNSARAVDAFALLHQHRVSALAITDERGSLSGNISLKDVCHVMEDLRNLLLPVFEFVNQIRRSSLKAVMPSVEGHPNDSFGSVIERFHAIRLHRLYVSVSAKDHHPVGVVSVGDVLNVLLKHL